MILAELIIRMVDLNLDMNTVVLDVRAIPQLYGSSYHEDHEDSIGIFTRPPSSEVRGSCLTASLEMMVDWLKRANRKPANLKKAYSTFANALFLKKHAKIGHPNGDEYTHLMWNQATLHFTIYCSAQRMIELLDFFGMPTRTISLTPPSAGGILETREHATSRADLKQRIIQLLSEEKKPVIALVNDMEIQSEQYHQECDEITPFPDMPPSDIRYRKTPVGHAVVLAGIDLERGHLLVLDPSPSIQLEKYPERFHNTESRLSDPNNHRHRVDLDEFVKYLQSTRSLITFDVDVVAEIIKAYKKQIIEVGRSFGIDLYGGVSWDDLPGTHDGEITSLDADTCIEFVDHDLSRSHILASIDDANRMEASLLIFLCQSEFDAASLKNKIEDSFTPKTVDDDPDILVISVSDL